MNDLQKFQAVNKTETLEELALLIESFADEKGMIPGRERMFDAKKMAHYCRYYCIGIYNTLTREYGIRQQAMYLLMINNENI